MNQLRPDNFVTVAWSDLTDWWLAEIEDDTAYTKVVTPLLLETLNPLTNHTYLDFGCGEGRVMREVEATGAIAHGVDINSQLAARAHAMVADLLNVPVESDSYDGAYAVLTLEHIEDHLGFFAEAARVTKSGGVLAVVVNHPIWTAPGSTPITDSDGEVLWRAGDYFSTGKSEVPAGDATVTFHHRSMAELLNAASSAGWRLDRMTEQPHHDYEDQAGIPRLLACRWIRA